MSATLRASTQVNFNGFDSNIAEKNNMTTSISPEVTSPRFSGIVNILGDSEGVKLFNNFLCMRNSGHLLDFWFACKGFRSNVDPNNPDRLFQVAKVIYRTYVKSGASYAVQLPVAIKHEIVERMTSYHKGYKNASSNQIKQGATGIDRTLFDAAQENVGSMLERMFYPEFLEYLQNTSIHTNTNLTGSSGVNVEKPSGNIPFPQVCAVASPKSRLKLRRKSFRQFSQESFDDSPLVNYPAGIFSPPPTDRGLATIIKSPFGAAAASGGKLPMRMTTSWTTTSAQSPLPTTTHQSGSHAPRASLPACDVDCALCPCPEWDRTCDPPFSSPVFTPLCAGDGHPDKDRTRHSTVVAPTDLGMGDDAKTGARRLSTQSDRSDQTGGPVVRQPFVNPDGEWQPLATDSAAAVVACAGPNKPKDVLLLLERRTDQELAKPRQNLAETDPAAFVLLLTSRLEKVKESRGKIEKLLSWVNQVDEKNAVDTSCSVSGNDPMDDLGFAPNPSADQPIATDEQALVRSARRTAGRSQTPPASLPAAFLTKPPVAYELKSRAFVPLRVEDDDAQGILDEHCSRIWADEQDCPVGPPEATDFNKTRPSDPDCMTQSGLESHGMVSQRTLRRSRGTYGGSPNHATTRRRTALSAAMVHSFTGELDSAPAHSETRRRVSMRNHNRGTDARSTASWDSGVVLTNCPYAPESPFTTGTALAAQGELETRSIVAAASLQALSSSTTELAMVNSEVTTKLVEHMTRHHRRPMPEPVTHGLVQHPFASKLSPYQNYDLFSPPTYRSIHHPPASLPTVDPMTGKSVFAAAPGGGGSTAILDNSGQCMSCVQNTWRPCVYHQAQAGWPADKPNNATSASVAGSVNTYGFPSASDTSSTFDSGISSTYDHLPMGLSQNNPTDRGTRSQSLRNWHASFRETSTGGSQLAPRPMRTPSAPRPQYHSNQNSSNNNNPSMHVCRPCSHAYLSPNDGTQTAATDWSHPITTYYTDEAIARGLPGCPHPCAELDKCCCTCSHAVTSYNPAHNTDPNGKDVSHTSVTRPTSGCRAGSGQLLQHWLYLQTGQSVCSEDGPTSLSKPSGHSRKQQQQQPQHGHHHHHQHHNRRSGATHRHSNKHAGISPMDRDSFGSKEQSVVTRPGELLSHSKTTCPLDSIEAASGTQTGLGLIVGYYLCDDPVPYRTVWTGAQSTPAAVAAPDTEGHSGSTGPNPCASLTLGQFKQLIAKKGSYRYFFKKPSDEFGTGVVHEELTQDDAVIPLWDGKVVARIERAE